MFLCGATALTRTLMRCKNVGWAGCPETPSQLSPKHPACPLLKTTPDRHTFERRLRIDMVVLKNTDWLVGLSAAEERTCRQ